MPPQEKNISIEDLVARAKAKQQEQKERIVKKKEEKILRSKSFSMPHIKPFDPEKNKLSGKDYASGEKNGNN